jgi:hypothetical protein
MDTRKLVETQSKTEATKTSDSGRPAESVKLVEMGPVSVETKGFVRGIEIGFTPKS